MLGKHNWTTPPCPISLSLISLYILIDNIVRMVLFQNIRKYYAVVLWGFFYYFFSLFWKTCQKSRLLPSPGIINSFCYTSKNIIFLSLKAVSSYSFSSLSNDLNLDYMSHVFHLVSSFGLTTKITRFTSLPNISCFHSHPFSSNY